MARTQWHPAADTTQQYPYAGRQMRTVNTLVLHTTEGSSWPSYSGSHPTFTYNPHTHQLRQHIPVDYAAMALRDLEGGIKPNWLNCAQIEIIGTSGWNPTLAANGWHVKDIDQQAIDELGGLVRWLHEEWELPLSSIQPWSHARLSNDEYTNFYGVLGHQHVPENNHSDPGNAVPIDRIMAAAGAGTGTGAGGGVPSGVVTPPPAPPGPPAVSQARLLAAIRHDVPAPNGATSYPADVRPVEQALADLGLLDPRYVDGSAGSKSFGPGSAYQRWQLQNWPTGGTRLGQACDGYPGAESLNRLAARTNRFVRIN